MAEQLQIPEDALAGIKEVSKLNIQTAKSLAQALEQAVPTLYPQALAASLSDTVQNLKEEQINAIAELLFGLYSVQKYSNLMFDDLASLVRQAVEKDERLFDFSSEQYEAVEQNLKILLNDDDSINLSADATSIIQDYERVLADAKIYTDMRPIFRIVDEEEEPAAIAITHTLKILYKDITGVKELFVSLDSADLGLLEVVITEAMSREDSLKSMLDRAKIPLLNPSYEDIDSEEGEEDFDQLEEDEK